MAERILQSFLLLIPILICTSTTSAYSEYCSSLLNPFTCLVNEPCFITVNNGFENDCDNRPVDTNYGVKFKYKVRMKKGSIFMCEGCCCPPVVAHSKDYQNSCPKCVTLWSESLENKTLTFSGSEDIMEMAIENKALLNMSISDDLPASVTVCPTEKKNRCKLHSNINGNWTIVSAANKKWGDYFGKSLPNGFITVKQRKDFIKLAIKREDINKTRIHFLKVSVKKKNDKCRPCLEPEESTKMPIPTSPKPSTQTQPMNDASTNVVQSSNPSTSQASTIPAWNTSNAPFIRISKKNSLPISDSHSEEDSLETQLNSTGNGTEDRLKLVAAFVKEHDHLGEDDLSTAMTEISKDKNKFNENITKDFADVVNKVSLPTNWENPPSKKLQPSDIMNATETYFGEATRHIKDRENAKSITKRNIIMHYGNVPRQRPRILYSFTVSMKTTVRIPRQVLQTATSARIRYSFVLYKSLAITMKKVATSWNEKESQSEQLNSPILSISIYPHLRTPLKKNINFTLYHNKRSNSRLICAYWNFSYKSRATGFYGRWETDGCYVVSQNQSCTTCSCNHLTNFALLMSIHNTVENNAATKIISLISGSISSFSVLITIACYAVIWPDITQNPVNRSRAIILMNLCVALLTANIIFLVGSQQYANKAACKAISALLHFFYLAVFFSMLMEGIDMFITVILVFSKKIKVKWFILGTWIFPLLIVGISLLVKFDNYVDPNNCWISVHGGLRLAFIGPAFFIIFINTIILIIVISRMLRTREMMQKTVQERVRIGARGIALLSPVLGFTWITGFFLLNDHPTLQYVFMASYSLQGIFIFLLHCLFSRQVREGFCQWLHKKSYMNELSNSTMKCAAMDQTNVTPTISTAHSLDELDSYQNKLSEFQPRKSVDLLIPGK